MRQPPARARPVATPRVLTTEDHAEWAELLARAGHGDVYARPDYLALWEGPYGGTAECFVYEDSAGLVLYPYIKRRIGGTDRHDLTSAYGFGGLIRRPTGIDPSGFDSAFRAYCRRERVVSEFIRFHPLFPDTDLTTIPGVRRWTSQPVVFSDPAAPDGGVRREVLKKVRKAAANGITVDPDPSGAHLEAFAVVYRATMERKQAARFYHFDEAFFARVTDLARDGSAVLFMARCDGQPAGGLLVLCGDRFVYNFLSGSDPAFTRLGVNDALQHAALEWARAGGFAGYVLGGGMLGRDSLFDYKARFSPLTRDFVTAARIHDPDRYRELSASHPDRDSTGGFFPAYRARRPA